MVELADNKDSLKSGMDAEIGTKLPNEVDSFVYVYYNYRWVILLVYIISCISSSLQWGLYVIIGNVLVDYYDSTYEIVNWTLLIFYVCYVLFIYPCVYLVEKWGLRASVIIGTLLSAIGAWIKVASISSDRLWVIMLGQVPAALSQNFLISIPASIAATWFGPDQISLACSLGTVGYVIGLIISCLLPSALVESSQDKEVLGHGLYKLALVIAITTSVILVIAFLGFREKPPTPPSRAQINAKKESVDVMRSLKRLAKDTQFMMYFAAFTLNSGFFVAMGSMLPQILFTLYENATTQVGILVIVLLLTGMFGSVIFGYLLDRFRKFRAVTIFLFIASVINIIAFTLLVNRGLGVVYVVVAMMGLFSSPVISTGFSVAAQITYPEPESVLTGLLLLSSKVVGIIITQLYSFLVANQFGIWAHLSMCSVVLFSAILIVAMRFNLKRDMAEKC